VGTVEITGCEPFTPEIANELRRAGAYFRDDVPSGLFAWKLANPARLDHPIPYRGRLGFFEVDLIVAAGVR
jgi:hypothetical protein